MSDKPYLSTHYKDDLEAQTRVPLPMVTGGIGLLLAMLFPEGLSGAEGFLIGFAVGLSVPIAIALYLTVKKEQRGKLSKETGTALSQSNPLGTGIKSLSEPNSLGPGIKSLEK